MSTPGRSGLVFEEPLLFERSRPGRSGARIDPPGVPAIDPIAQLGAGLVRDELEDLPELSELDVVRHFTRLSQWNFSIDTGFFPLGSCTMKYNPKRGDVAASLDGLANLHPLAADEDAQGMLALAAELEDALAGFVPCAVSGISTRVRCVSPRAR